jgi:ATP-dependent DNA helicase RecG
MAVTPEQIDQWRSSPSETEILEFKEAKTQYDSEKLFAYCVAIANEGGGRLLLGIKDKPVPRPIVGTQAFPDLNAVSLSIFNKLHFRVRVEECLHSAGRILVFRIPSRPVGSPYSLEGQFLMRCGESTIPMTEDKLREIFSETKEHWLEEAATPSSVSAQDVVELLDTQAFFGLLKLPYPTTRAEVVNRLEEVRLIVSLGDKYSIKRIGAILLAKKLDSFFGLERKAPRVVVYSGQSKLETKLDHPGIRGYAVGFSGLVKFVCSLLPQNEVIEDAIRKQIKLISADVIRELIANALIHQDFAIEGTSVMIEIYNDRVEITNPGKPVVPVERFIDGCHSRNERFAALMRKIGICEEKGSGIDRVVNVAEVYQLPAPDFRGGYDNTRVTIYGPKKFLQMDGDDRVRACYQHCALKYVMHERMTNTSLRKRFGLDPEKSSSASGVIAQTIEAGLIKRKEGASKKYAKYLPFWA